MTFETRRRLLSAACVFFATLGVALAVLGRTAAFAPWRQAAADAVYGSPMLPVDAVPFVAATDAILGGAVAGKWVAAWWLVRVPLARRSAWALHALGAGLVVWFIVDLSARLRAGATFGAWMIDLVPLLVVGSLLWSMRAEVHPDEPRPASSHRAWLLLRWSCWAFALFGLVIAFFPRSFVFDRYNAALAEAYATGSADIALLASWERFAAASIGATLAGHFVMLALTLAHARGRTWVLHAVWTSVVTWFVIDTAGSLIHGAAFNVVLLNLPSAGLIFTLTLLAWLAEIRDRDRSHSRPRSGARS